MDKAERDMPVQRSEYFYWDLQAPSPVFFQEFFSRYSRTGTLGDPTKATCEKGRRFVEAVVDRMIAVIRDLRETGDPPASGSSLRAWMRIVFACLALLCGLSGGQDLASRIESGLSSGSGDTTWNLADCMAHYRTPAVSIAVLRGGKIVLAKGYGVIETGGRAVDTNTLSRLRPSVNR